MLSAEQGLNIMVINEKKMDVTVILKELKLHVCALICILLTNVCCDSIAVLVELAFWQEVRSDGGKR